MFVVFEGVDGAGKSTQVELCQRWFESQGLQVTVCRDPGSTELGVRIREILLKTTDTQISSTSEVFLFMAARAQLVSEVITPALQEGHIVLCDRFLLSTVVYQGHAGDLDPGVIWQIGSLATAGLEPSITIVLDLPVDIALRRVGPIQDRMESRGSEFLQRVRDGFSLEANQKPRIHLLNALGSVDELHNKVKSVIENYLPG